MLFGIQTSNCYNLLISKKNRCVTNICFPICRRKMTKWAELIPSQFQTSAFISGLRAFLSRRDLRPNVRRVEDMSPATRPPPAIPKGPSHKLTNNSYCLRDARGLVTPPIIIVDQTTENPKLCAKKTSTKPEPTGLPLPGNTHQWD